tara:strand:- start:85 stop:849 length:765 start_codon:yes stop_codon:yes gene_type:complete
MLKNDSKSIYFFITQLSKEFNLEIFKNHNNKNLGYLKDLDVFFKLIDWEGLKILDVGCGNGDLSIALSQKGADVFGLENDSIQAKKNSVHDITNVRFLHGSAHEIPFESEYFDSVIFSKSLHHVPITLMDSSILETIRVLKKNGFLFVLEPDIHGTFYDLIKPFHDETRVRLKAIETLDNVANKNFKNLDEFYFTSKYIFKDFDTFLKKMSGSTFNNISEESIDNPHVNKIFNNGFHDGQYYFENRMLVRIYKN